MLILALLIGVIAGLRALTAPAAVALGVRLGVFTLTGTPFAFMGTALAAWILGLLALGELVSDKLPRTPSRKVPVQFATRILMGGLAGASIGAIEGLWFFGGALGVIGAVLGTLSGASVRARLAKKLGHDLPAAFVEDAVAVIGATLVILTTLRI